MNEKIYAIISVARQVNGEFVFIRTEKAFEDPKDAEAELKLMKEKATTEDGNWKSQLIKTPNGDAICRCEIGLFEMELFEKGKNGKDTA